MPPRGCRCAVSPAIELLHYHPGTSSVGDAGPSLTSHLPYSLTYGRTRKPSGGRKAAVMTVQGRTPLVSQNPASNPAGLGWTFVRHRPHSSHAAQSTGASFDYLLARAKTESDLNPGCQYEGRRRRWSFKRLT